MRAKNRVAHGDQDRIFFVDVQCLCEVLFFFFAFLLRCPRLHCSCKCCFLSFYSFSCADPFFFFEAVVLAM